MVFLFILIRTTANPLFSGFLWQWDILLPFVIFFGQRRSLAEGLILSLFTSHLYSLCSSAPIGVFTTHYLILFMIARLLSLVIYANTWFSVLLLMLSLTIFSRILLTVVAAVFGHAWPLVSGTNFVWWGLILNAVLGYAIYGFLGSLDRMTYKTPLANIEVDMDL